MLFTVETQHISCYMKQNRRHKCVNVRVHKCQGAKTCYPGHKFQLSRLVSLGEGFSPEFYYLKTPNKILNS